MTIVGGRPHRETVVRNETPAAPTATEVAAVELFFATHDVAAEDIPSLSITPADR